MRQYTAIHDLAADDILYMLQQWENKKITYNDVFVWAEALLDTKWISYDKEDQRSIIAEIVSEMEYMYARPWLRKDIPFLRNVVLLSATDPLEAWHLLDAYMKSTNWTFRKEQQQQNVNLYRSDMLDTIKDPDKSIEDE